MKLPHSLCPGNVIFGITLLGLLLISLFLRRHLDSFVVVVVVLVLVVVLVSNSPPRASKKLCISI